MIIWWLVSLLPFWASALKWRNYQYDGPHTDATEQFIALKTTIRGPACPLQVVRWQKGHPSAHIFLVAPEAGQAAAAYWESRLGELLRMYGRDFCLYAVDLRGTGESSPLRDTDLATGENGDSDDERTYDRYANASSASESEPESPDGELRLGNVTIQGQAEDLLEAMRMTREEPGFAGSFYLHARAFGCLIAARVIETSDASTPVLGALLESPLPAAYGPLPGPLDADLIGACTNDADCKKILGMDAVQVRTAVASLASRHLNQCTRLLHEALERESAAHSKLGHNASDWLRLLELFHWISRLPGSGVAILLPLVQSTFVCANTSKYEQQVLPDLLRGVIGTLEKGRTESFDLREPERGINSFVNAWLMLHEWLGMGTRLGRQQNACKDALFRGLASPCVLYRYYRRHTRTFKGFLRRGHDDTVAVPYKIKGGNTRLIFAAGALDVHAPAGGARDWHANSTSDRGTFVHVFMNQAGMPLGGTTACVSQIGDELLRGGSAEAVEGCLRRPEANTMDWNFASLKGMSVRDWWAPAGTPQADGVPKPPAGGQGDKIPADGNRGDSMTRYLSIIAIVVGVVVLIAVIFDLVLRFRGRTPLGGEG